MPMKIIYGSHDMTKDERKHIRALVEKAKKQTQELAQNDQNTSKNWAYKVRGPPWNQRIEKVRIQQQQ